MVTFYPLKRARKMVQFAQFLLFASKFDHLIPYVMKANQ